MPKKSTTKLLNDRVRFSSVLFRTLGSISGKAMNWKAVFGLVHRLRVVLLNCGLTFRRCVPIAMMTNETMNTTRVTAIA